MTWAGTGTAGYPGSGRDPEAGRNTTTGTVYDHLNGFCFHLYGYNGDPAGTPDTGPGGLAEIWWMRTNWFLSRVGKYANGPGGAEYPSYLGTLPVYATEMGFPSASTEGNVKAAYQGVVDHYRDLTTAPDNRLKRVYYHSSSKTVEDHLAHQGADPYVLDQWTLTTTLGIYHRDQLAFTNPGKV